MTDTKDDGTATRDSLAGGLMGLRRSRVSANEAEPTRTWNAQDWAEDQRYIDALDAIGKGLKRDALTMLVNLYKEDPGHLAGKRRALGGESARPAGAHAADQQGSVARRPASIARAHARDGLSLGRESARPAYARSRGQRAGRQHESA